jgi:hypothetical protein
VVVGGISRHEQLRGNDEIGAQPLPLGARAPQLGDIAVDVAHGWIELGDGDGEAVGHGGGAMSYEL